MFHTTKQLNGSNLGRLNTIATELGLNIYGTKKTKAQLIDLIRKAQNVGLEAELRSGEGTKFRDAVWDADAQSSQYTKEELTAKGMTKQKLIAIADSKGIDLQDDYTKANLVEWILFSQDQEAGWAEHQATLQAEPVKEAIEEVAQPEVEAIVQEPEESPFPELNLGYEENLILYLYERAEKMQDKTAHDLLAGFGAYKQSLTTKQPKPKSSAPRSTRVTDPAEKLAQAKLVWDKVQAHNGNHKTAAVELNKSPHYTKIIAQAYALYAESEMIRTAYDAGELRWTGLYNLAFNRKKTDTLAMVEATLAA